MTHKPMTRSEAESPLPGDGFALGLLAGIAIGAAVVGLMWWGLG